MLWFGHLVTTRILFGRLNLEDAFWSIAPDIPMALFLAPWGTPWSEMKKWTIYKILYQIPHSVVALWYVPEQYRKIYLLHILCDIVSHTGQWSIQPFFPLETTIYGIWDPISWS